MADKKVFSIQIDGIKQSVDGVESLGSAVNTNVSSIKELRTALKATKDEMAGLEKGTEQWNALAKVAGDYKDKIDDINQATARWASDTKTLDDALNIGKSMTSVFTLAEGAMSAFGLSTEGAVEQIQKLQGAMAIIQSIQSLQNTLRGSTATTDALTKAMKLMGLSMDGATKSTKLLRIGLSSIGIGLIIGLVMTLIEYWDDIKESFMNTFPILKTLSDKFNGLSGVIKGVGYALKHWLMNPIVTLGKALKKLFKGDFAGALKEIKDGFINQFTGLKDAFMNGVEASKQKVETASEEAGKTVVKNAKQTAKEVKDITEKMLDDLVKAQRKAFDEVQKMREEDLKKEKERLERLAKLRDKDKDAEYAYQKAKLKLDLAEAQSDEEKIKIKQKLLDLETKIAKEKAMQEAAETMGMSVEELQQRLDMTEGKWIGLNEEQKQVLQTLQTQLETIKLGAEEASKALSGTTSGGSDGGGSGSTSSSSGNRFKDFTPFGEGGIDLGEIGKTIEEAYDAYAAPIVEGLGDSIHMMLEFAIEEAENALEEAEEMHDEAVEKVSQSKDRLTQLNEDMKNSSGAQLEQYKQQMADEMLLLQQREQEERRLQKEKEKREKELEKQKKKQRKLELQQQLIQAIVSGALAVVNGLATQPFMPVGIAMGALAGVATAIQIATITKQLSKLADGGLLSGRSHAQGGIPVGSTGIEVEGGEYVVNKRSTAKYLPLLQQINEEGARHKTVANQLGKYADGGQLNYERINSNMDALNTAKIVSTAIGGIEMHPVVSVVDINRGQRNYAEVRQLAGASS